MDKVILFKKGIETLEFFSAEMGKSFEKMGFDVFYYAESLEKVRVELYGSGWELLDVKDKSLLAYRRGY